MERIWSMQKVKPVLQATVPSAEQELPRDPPHHPLALQYPGAIIDCRLFRVDLAANPKYEAVSYMWGSPENPKTIRLDGREHGNFDR
jgi:hypothetical protein